MNDAVESAPRKRKLKVVLHRPQKRHRSEENSNSANHSNHEYEYDTQETVLVYHGPALYKAKILQRTIEEQEPMYFVHYHGWNKQWDEWVEGARCLKYTQENIDKATAILKGLSEEQQEKLDKIEKCKNWELLYHQQTEVQKQYLDDLEQSKANLSREKKKCFDYMVEIRTLKMKHNEEMKEMNEKHDALRQAHDETVDVLRIYEGRSARIHKMDMNHLNNTETKLQNGLKHIQQAKQRLFDVKFKCVACLDRTKNVSVDGCSHVALCDQCEASLESKSCPLCQIPYTNVKKINF